MAGNAAEREAELKKRIDELQRLVAEGEGARKELEGKIASLEQQGKSKQEQITALETEVANLKG